MAQPQAKDQQRRLCIGMESCPAPLGTSNQPQPCAPAAAAKPESPTFCETCPCALSTALVAALVAADVRVNGQPLSTLASTNSVAFDNVLATCGTAVGLQILQSGAISAPAAAKLAGCDLETASDACVQQVLTAVLQGR